MKPSRLLSLGIADQWMALCAAALIPAYQIAVRSRLYRPTSWPLQTSGALHDGKLQEAGRVATVVNSVARHLPWPVSCLVRSLVLVSMLRRRGIESCLCIGVRMDQGSLDAHAWVEHQGVPINDRHDIGREFQTFAGELPGKAFPSP